MGSKEKVVIVAQDGHGHIPGQIQEGLQGQTEREVSQGNVVISAMSQSQSWKYENKSHYRMIYENKQCKSLCLSSHGSVVC